MIHRCYTICVDTECYPLDNREGFLLVKKGLSDASLNAAKKLHNSKEQDNTLTIKLRCGR